MDGFLRVLQDGGWLMLPIGLCSIVAVGITLERFYSLRIGRIVPEKWVTRIKQELSRGRISEALDLCQQRWEPICRVLEAGILRLRRDRVEIKEAIEATGRQEVELLERHLDFLATIANVAPLLGLLGTVAGMIEVFDVISTHGAGDPKILAGGISKALITTAAGLSVAIPTLFLHSHLLKRSHRLLLMMEKTALEVLELLVEQKGGVAMEQEPNPSAPRDLALL